MQNKISQSHRLLTPIFIFPLLLALISVILVVRAGVSFNSYATGSTGDLTSGMTWDHDITCGDDMVLIVGISVDSEPTATVSSITYNGTHLSNIAAVTKHMIN